MDMRKVTQEYRLNQWTEIVTKCIKSGQTVKSWCKENNINPKSYYYWLRRVRAAACNSLDNISERQQQIVPLNITVGEQRSSTEIKPVIYDASKTAIVININSMIIEIRNGATGSTIENTLRAIRNLC
jgi:transposase-like protein